MKQGFFRRGALGLAFALALVLGTMIFPASADDKDDETKKYAQTLASENGLQVGGVISSGGGSEQYALNSTSASAGRDLYVIELETTVSYERIAGPGDNCHMDAAVFYVGRDNKVYWTKYFNYDDYSEDFMNHESALVAGQGDHLSIQLPSGVKRILAFYFHKSGGPIQRPYEWAGSFLRVAKVNGSIESIGKDSNGFEYRDFKGTYVAGAAKLNELNYHGDGNHLWRLNQPKDTVNNSAAKSVYAIELVAGDDGYVNKDGTVTIDYTDSLGITYQRTVQFLKGYGDVQKDENVKGAEEDYNHTISSPWFQTSVREMQGLAAGYVGNFWKYQGVTETCLRPYTETTFLLTMPQNISRINAITVSLNENDSLVLQSARLFELSYLGKEWENYWNGGFSLERVRPWKGRLMAISEPAEIKISGGNSVTFSPGHPGHGLTTYPRGTGPEVDNQGTGVGVSIQLADVQGAGIEQFLAWNGQSYSKPDFKAAEKLKERAGPDARQAWFNLNIFRRECMTLTVRYRDTLKATRQVDIPLTTTYLVYLLKENQGKLSGGSWESWISGIFQQNENVALPLRLSEYASLISLKLSYGSAPEGFVSSNEGIVENDPITVENICFYEGVDGSNFTSKYDATKLACVFQTNLTPAYSYSAGSDQGQQLTEGGSITASLDDSNLSRGAPKARDYSNKYLVRIKTADIETAGTNNPVSLSFSYTDTSGVQHNTAEYSLPALANEFYGANFRYKGSFDVASDLQYTRHMRRDCRCEFVVAINNLGTLNSITLSIDGTNEWQIEYVEVFALTQLEQRKGTRSPDGGDASHLYWRRDFKGETIAKVEQSVLFYDRSNQHTINFTIYDESGAPVVPEQPVQKEDYLTSLPTSMTYTETLKNLGLAIPKFTYRVDVTVADLEDAGSSNYFYFQLIFENGASGVVLANQQLASDSFRRGMTESFLIKTTQNFGHVRSVRIICDNTSSTSNVFDKLNVERINITLSSSTGVSRSWVVDRVGWVDITYVDEGSDYGVDGLDDDSLAETNVELVKEFPVTGTATAVDLLFCITSSKDSAGATKDGMLSDPYNSALGAGGFNAVLYYRDGSGQQKSTSFDLTAQIRTYNDTDKTFWLYRPTHTDRFTLSLTDVQSITALEITRNGGSGVWKIDSVAVSQIGGLGDVFLSPSPMEEYFREPATEVPLTKGTNGGPVSISSNSNATISFQENLIEVVSDADATSWNTTISRVPDVSGERLNIYLYPGTLLTRPYTFQEGDSVRATVLYTSVYGGRPLQKGFDINMLGEYNGETVLYAKNLEISLMSAIRMLSLSTTDTATSRQPTIEYAVIERVKGGVLLDTYRFDMGNADLLSTSPQASISGAPAVVNMNQVARLQLSSGQSAKLTPETSDIAVALRYTTDRDPSPVKTVYQSPYYYLTDFTAPVTGEDGQVTQQRLYNAVSSGQIVDLPFDIDGIGEIVGLAVVSSGPNLTIDRALVNNYLGDPQTNAAATLDRDSSCYISESFVTSSIPSILAGASDLVVPVTFRFTTPSEEIAAGAGTSGGIDMTVRYQNSDGLERTALLTNLMGYLPEGSAFASGSSAEFTVLLTDARTITSLSIQAMDDSWFISSAAVQVSLPDGTVSTGETTVNNWARGTDTLSIDVRPDSLREGEAAGNQLLTFAVTGRSGGAGISASAASGSALQVTAYPGDTVTLTPTVTAQGRPDTTWTWVAGAYTNQLTVRDDGSASFYVPPSDLAGSSYTFSVHCSGDQRMSVPITVAVEAPPPKEAAPAPGLDFGGSSSGGEANTGGTDTPPEDGMAGSQDIAAP